MISILRITVPTRWYARIALTWQNTRATISSDPKLEKVKSSDAIAGMNVLQLRKHSAILIEDMRISRRNSMQVWQNMENLGSSWRIISLICFICSSQQLKMRSSMKPREGGSGKKNIHPSKKYEHKFQHFIFCFLMRIFTNFLCRFDVAIKETVKYSSVFTKQSH